MRGKIEPVPSADKHVAGAMRGKMASSTLLKTHCIDNESEDNGRVSFIVQTVLQLDVFSRFIGSFKSPNPACIWKYNGKSEHKLAIKRTTILLMFHKAVLNTIADDR